MNSEEEHEIQSEDVGSELMFLAINLKEFPEAMEKSQIPEIKKKKDAAITALVKLYENNFCKVITTKTLLKKINNMKTRLKKKIDRKQTGNRPIQLNSWEKILYELLDGESNPTLKRLSGAMTAGINLEEGTSELNPKRMRSLSPNTSKNMQHDTSSIMHKTPQVSRKKEALRKYEPEVSRSPTNTELQRLVLLEQLETARAQKDAARAQETFYKGKIQQKSDNSIVYYDTNTENSYINL